MFLEDFSLPCRGGLWLGYLWWSSGNLDFTFVEHASFVILVVSSSRMTLCSVVGV